MVRSPMAWLRSTLHSAAWLALSLSIFLAPVPAARAQQIPAHPRDLKYPKLAFTPPQASRYRQVLKNGVVGYFVEDHDLPLINVSVTVRVGSYLDPAGKEGLAAAVGSQLRAGGTAHYKAEDFDEEADYLAANMRTTSSSASSSPPITPRWSATSIASRS